MIVKSVIPSKFHPEKSYNQPFFTRKKMSIKHPQNGRFGDFETEPEIRFGNRIFFFIQFNSLLQFFGVFIDALALNAVQMMVIEFVYR